MCNHILKALEPLEPNHHFDSLIAACSDVIADRFHDFDRAWQFREFRELGASSVSALLKSDDLRVFSENTGLSFFFWRTS